MFPFFAVHSATYAPQWAKADGATVLMRGADGSNSPMTGWADSPLGVLNMGLRINALTGAPQIPLEFARQGVYDPIWIAYNNAGEKKLWIELQWRSDDNLTIKKLTWTSTAAYDVSAELNVLTGWDTNQAAGSKLIKVVINGTEDVGTVSDTASAFDIRYTKANNTTIFGQHNMSAKCAMSMRELFLGVPSAFFNPTNGTNYGKFYDGSGTPVDLGDTGQLPLGDVQRMYQTLKPTDSSASAFVANRGNGGGMTLYGDALTIG